MRRPKVPTGRIELPISGGSSMKDAESLVGLLNLESTDRQACIDWAEFEAQRVHQIHPDEDPDLLWRIFLNHASSLQTELQECADSWMSADCHFEGWIMADRFERMIQTYRVRLEVRNDRPLLSVIHDFEGSKPDNWLAFSLFLSFICGPYHAELGRCVRCNRYFVNTSGRSDKKYCRQRCASSDWAERTGEQKRTREKEEKRQAIQQTLDEVAQLSERKRAEIRADLKRHLADRATARLNKSRYDLTPITTNYVTRLLKGGYLKIPESLREGVR